MNLLIMHIQAGFCQIRSRIWLINSKVILSAEKYALISCIVNNINILTLVARWVHNYKSQSKASSYIARFVLSEYSRS